MGFIRLPGALTSRETSKVSKVNDRFPQDAVKRALTQVFSHLVAVSELTQSTEICINPAIVKRQCPCLNQ